MRRSLAAGLVAIVFMVFLGGTTEAAIIRGVTPSGVPVIATEGAPFSGLVATFTDTNLSHIAATFSASIEWGDVSLSAGLISGGSGAFTISGAHTYASAGANIITVILSGAGGSVGVLSAAVVADVPLTPIGLILHLSPGVPTTGPVGKFSDPGANFSYMAPNIDWGDGTNENANTIVCSLGVCTISNPSSTHSYPAGTFIITTFVFDTGGAQTVIVSTAEVGVHPPSTPGVFRGGAWFLNNQNDSSAPELSFFFGGASDIPVAGDWNCNGTKTAGVFRNGAWYLNDQNDTSAPEHSFFFGSPGDIPVVGDWDGDGCDGIGVFRNGAWFLNNQVDGSPPEFSFFFGSPTDMPVTGDWDANGTTTIGVFRSGNWFLRNSNIVGPPDLSFSFGSAGDVPVTGDWDGNGTTTIGVFRSGNWFLNNQNDASAPEFAFAYGAPTDVPVTGFWSTAGAAVVTGQVAAASCAQGRSCAPATKDPRGRTPCATQKSGSSGWTGPVTMPPPGWTGKGVKLPPGWTGVGATP